MKRAALIAFQLALAVLVGLGARELWLARSDGESSTGESREIVTVDASVTPSVHTFGDPVVATVEVVANASLIKPETIRIDTDFGPYELDGKQTVERTVVGDTVRAVFRFPLRCLQEGCDPAGRRGVAQFEDGFVRYRFIRGSGPGRDFVDWPAFEVASRVSAADAADLRWRASETALPDATTRLGPTALAAGLVGVALALAGLALWLARRLWRVERRTVADGPAAQRTPLERALDLVLADTRNGSSPPARRQALERLARELSTAGLGSLADEVRGLAWAPHAATEDDVVRLVGRVSESAGLEATA